MILSVDLAAKFSAVVARELGGEVALQFDSRGLAPLQFASKVAEIARREDCELVLIEDVPYGISSQAMTKPVLRLQGILIAFLHPVLENVFWVSPSRWMSDFPGIQTGPKGLSKSMKDKARIEAARQHAEDRGYTAPDLIAEYVQSLPPGTRVLKKHTGPLEKSMTDYVSAFLMSEWALGVLNNEGREYLLDLQGVSPSMI